MRKHCAESGSSERLKHKNDPWVAASALVAGVALITFDAHFGHIDGLRAVQRWSDVLQ